MSFIFYICSSLISLPDISKWNINNVKYMIDIFKGCNSLVSLPDFSKWNINRAKECYEFIDMERETSEFQYKDKFKKFKFNNIDSMNMYDECLSLLSLPNFKKSDNDNNELHTLNISIIYLTLLIFHLEISCNDINDEHL